MNLERIAEAEKYVGLKEDVPKDNAVIKKFIGFDPASTAWCAGFMNALEKALGRSGTGKLNARSYLKYGQHVDVPDRGDLVVFKRGNSSWEGHIAIFIKEDDQGIYVLGGNQNNMVCYKHYSKNDVLDYRRNDG